MKMSEAEAEATPAQLSEYETQLRDVEELLKASPNDESLLALKNDLVELVSLTKATLGAASESASLPPPPPPPPPQEEATPPPTTSVEAAIQAGLAAATAANNEDPATEQQETAAVPVEGKKKKKKKLKDFVLPDHLIPLDTDTEAERNRKRRTAKALKSKWREQKKQIESEQKQKSWQSFQKKTKKRGKDESIFSTQEGVADRVGVISKKQMTDNRKRQKHDF